MDKEHKYILGKCDYNNSGRKNCEAVFTYDLKNGKFSLCAEIWNPRKTDIYCGGQCVEEVLKYFPHDKRAHAMARVWRLYHLNDMIAGSPAQEAHLAANKAEYEIARTNGVDHYEWAQATLEAAGLQPDKNFMYGGQPGEHIATRAPYSYGTAWLEHDIPPEVIAEIEGWKKGHDCAADADLTNAFDAFLASHYDFNAVYIEQGERGDEYRCAFTHKNKYDEKGRAKPRLVASYYQGVGNRKNMLGKPYDKRSDRMTGAFSPKKSAPTAKAVLDALIRDAQVYRDNTDIADFCENFGYELREGRRVHAACEKTLSDLRDFAGADFQYLMNSEEGE